MHVCSANTRQYNQASMTTFAMEPLASFIRPHADTPNASRLLDGTPLPTNMSHLLRPETLQLLHTISSSHNSRATPLDTSFTTDDFISCYNTVREHTSSSLSGRHIGHYKAAASFPNIASIHATIMSLPFKMGFSHH